MADLGVLTGEWTDYHKGETRLYDCGSCHSTGYQSGGFPPNLPGISGTFALPGVECEHCHGPGNTMTAGSVSLLPNASAQSLGYSNLSYQLTREDFLGTATACPGFANNTQ
jgi:hypothetical protein